jgi:hypothetical protein
MNPSNRPFRLLALAALTICVCSCGGGMKNPVSGKVTHKGEPCKGAMVIFHPVGDDSPIAVRPSAIVADDGTFKLTSDPKRPGDGAKPGEYIVAVIWLGSPPKTDGKASLGSESKGGEVDRLGGRYRDQTVSKLRVTVKSGNNELEPFVLD